MSGGNAESAFAGARSGPDARPRVFAALDALRLEHRTVEHPPIRTVEEGRAYRAEMPGAATKNLFVVDKAGAPFLIICHGERRAKLKALAKALGAEGRFSFAGEATLLDVLGVTPGSVSAFALLNDDAGQVRAVGLDKALLDEALVWAHPLDNAASTGLAPGDLLRFLRSRGIEPRIVDIEEPDGA
ncbi:MAG: prolyl-tRNA synthetase associated domain-containing protein [Pseudomonadota bacterium]